MIDDSTFMLILILLCLNTVTPTLFDQVADESASVEQRLEFVLKITRSKIKGLDWNSEYCEGVFIDAFEYSSTLLLTGILLKNLKPDFFKR
jgi:hypothetical protein